MSTRANIGRVLDEMRNGRPALSTDITATMVVQGEVVSAFTLLTAKASLTALCEDKAVRYSIMADVRSVHSDAVASCWWQNTGAVGSVPTFTSIVS